MVPLTPEADMSSTRNTLYKALKRALAPPAFRERVASQKAELLHWILLACLTIALLALLVGVPFFYSNKPLASIFGLLFLTVALWSWNMCRRGQIQASAYPLIASLWLLAAGFSLLSHRTDFVWYTPALFVALLLSGPVLALVVAGSAIAIFAGVHIAAQVGIDWPRLFPAPPHSVLFSSIAFLSLAAIPVAILARQFRIAIEDFSQFRAAQRDLRIVTWIWDITSDRVWWDGDLSPLLGLAPGSYSGRFEDYLKFLKPEDVPFARQRYIDCLKGKIQFYSGEDCITWPDGSRHWLAVSGQAAYSPGGRAHRMTGVVIDVTERKNSELALAHTRERLAIAFNASPDAIVITNLSDGRIVDANPAFSRYVGISLESARGRTGLELGIWRNAADREIWFKTMREQGEIRDKIFDFRASDGTERIGRLSGSIVSVDGEQCFINVVRDVTEQVAADRRLRESEAKYSAFFDTCPDPAVITRAKDGVHLSINQAWCDATGYTREEGLGRSTLDLNLWANLADRQAILAQVATQGKLLNFATRFVRKDGAAIEVLLSAAAIDLGGEPCIASIWRDVTELLRMEREHVQSNQRYRTLFDAALDAIVIISPDGRMLDINAVGLRATGYSGDELIGKNVALLFDSKELAMHPLRLARVFSDGELRARRTVRARDGHGIPVDLVAGPLPDGNILAIVRDMSERKRNQALLQNVARAVSGEVGEDFFRSLVGNLSKELAADYCFIGEIVPNDPTKVRTLAFCANGVEAPNFEYSLEGSPCADAIAKRGAVAFPAKVCEQFPRDLGLQRMGVQGYAGTSLIDSKGVGIGILVVMSRTMITEVGLWTSVLGIFGARAAAEIQRARADAGLRELNLSLDQKVRERTAELELANRELESFSYSISHDLRAPLRAINGFTRILSLDHQDKLDQEASSLLGRISQNATRMNRLIEDVLEFTRIGRGTLNPRKIDMRAMVGEVAAESQAGAGTSAQISIGDLPPATGDASVLRLVWQNLIGNALKFSRHAVLPRVEIAGTQRDGMIEYLIRDNGAGFDAAYADKLFGIFQRLHSAKEFEGTGIGLAIVRRIVQRHGGEIFAEGAVGAGATFRFTLPE
ncbi:MAG: PAS domain S-box protein [Proteobacteria bacterium]|nr:PAS domain S-box protein [Pseudomonadota bacterium]